LIEGGARGWTDAWAVALLALAAGGVVAFLVVESRVARPMLPPAVLRRGRP
jgi:MFS transporter, DHA2 family, methylenomycin A resistance protein